MSKLTSNRLAYVEYLSLLLLLAIFVAVILPRCLCQPPPSNPAAGTGIPREQKR